MTPKNNLQVSSIQSLPPPTAAAQLRHELAQGTTPPLPPAEIDSQKVRAFLLQSRQLMLEGWPRSTYQHDSLGCSCNNFVPCFKQNS